MQIIDQFGHMRGWSVRAGLEEAGDRLVELIACGDTGPVRNLESVVLKKGPEYVLKDLVKDLNSADFVFVNLEAPYSERGVAMNKKPVFCLSPQAFSLIPCAGINVVSLANNHIFDYGIDAFNDTICLLKTAEITYFGAGLSEKEAIRPALAQAKDIKLAFLGFMDQDQVAFLRKHGIGAVPRMELQTIQSSIESIRGKVDWVIVSLHFGLEYTKYPAPRDIGFCRKLIDCGADIILAHHPHYPQGVEKYRHGLIAYSLGNFVWDQNFAGHTASSYMLKLKMSKHHIVRVQTVPFKMNSTYSMEKCHDPEVFQEIDLLSSTLLDKNKYPKMWYFTTRDVFLSIVKNLYSILYVGEKHRHLISWVRTFFSSRVLYASGYFLVFLFTLKAFIYELQKKRPKKL